MKVDSGAASGRDCATRSTLAEGRVLSQRAVARLSRQPARSLRRRLLFAPSLSVVWKSNSTVTEISRNSFSQFCNYIKNS